MGLKEAIITLDNPWNTYYTGQTVNGKVDFTIDSPKKIRGIIVKFKGEAKTSWSESQSQRNAEGKTHNVTLTHSGQEEYFQIQYYVLGSKSGNEIEMPSGKHSYNFTCALPPTLPSSFEGEYGYVRYTVKVTLDRPWKFDQDTKMAFTVISPMDLNLNPSYREPIRIQFEKTFCCCCCKSAPLSIDVVAPVSGYCPGQTIPIEINCENHSNVQVHLIKVTLRKLVTFRATTPKSTTKKSKVVISELSEGPVCAGADKNWKLSLDVPPIPPSNLTNCGIIDLDYDLKVECATSGVHLNLQDKRTVTIGTVPLVGFNPPPAQPSLPGQPAQPSLPGQSAQPSLPSQPGMAPSAPLMQGDLPPGVEWSSPDSDPSAPHQSLYPSLSQPVYQESAFNAKNIQDSQYTNITGRADFAPRYPTYAVPQLPR